MAKYFRKIVELSSVVARIIISSARTFLGDGAARRARVLAYGAAAALTTASRRRPLASLDELDAVRRQWAACESMRAHVVICCQDGS